MKKVLGIVVSLALIAGTLTGCTTSLANTTGDGIVKSKSDHLIVQGNIEVKEIDINSKLAGKVAQVKIVEGQQVKKGDVLIVLESDTILAKQSQTKALIEAANGQLKAAQAAKEAAAAQLQKAQNGARPQEVSQAKAAYELAQTTYDRIKTLYDEGVVSKSQLDEAETKLQVTKESYELAKEGARSEDKLSAQAQVAQADSMIVAANGKLLEAQGGLKEVETYIKDTVITAPMDGTVTQLNVESGELISTGMPLVVLSKVNDQWVEVNINETDLSMVSVNKEVSVRLPAYKDQEFKGKVVRINEKPDFAVKRATNDNGEFDVLAYGVKVQLENVNKPLHPGMTAIVDFGKRSDK